MGLFDFVGSIGKKLFSKPQDAAAELKKYIEADNPGIENLTVTVTDGIATLTGKANSAQALEKAVLMAGNTEGIKEVIADGVELPANEKIGANDEFYIIEKGDTLWKIAEKAYGDGAKYTKIVEVNKEVIKNPDLIFPGQKIRIPKDL